MRELSTLISVNPHIATALKRGEREAFSEVATTALDAAGVAGDVMGAKEVAAELDVGVANIRKVANLPEPVAEVAATRLWDADEIRAFARERKRNPPGRWTQKERT